MATGARYTFNEEDVERTKLEAFRNSLQITDRILSERPNISLKFERAQQIDSEDSYLNPSWAARSYGNEIYINVSRVNKPQSPDGIATILGMNYHELAHVMLTPPDRQVIKDAYTPVGSTGPLARKTLHKSWDGAYAILEEHRIETLLGAKYPSMQKYFAYAVLSQVVERTTPDQLNIRHLLTHGRHHLPKKVRSTFKDFFEKAYGEDPTNQVEKIIDEYRFIPYASRADEVQGSRLVQALAILLEQCGITPPTPSHSDNKGDDGGEPSSNKEMEAEQRKQMAKKAKEQEKKDEEEQEQQEQSEQQEEQDQNPDEPDEEDEVEDEDSTEEEDDEEGGESDDDPESGDDESDTGDPESGDETDGDDSEPESSGEDSGSEDFDGDDPDDDSDGGANRENGGGDDEADSGDEAEADSDTGQGDADAPGEDVDDDDRTGQDSPSVGVGKGNADIIDQSEIQGALEEIMAGVLSDDEILGDIQKYQSVMDSPEGLASTLEMAPEKDERYFYPVTAEMFSRSEQVAVQLRQIWARMEPGWEYGVAEGQRLNMQNAMLARDPSDYEFIHDDWSPGQQDNSKMVVVVLGDRSSSMADYYRPPNASSLTREQLRGLPNLATVSSRNIWEIKNALQEVDAEVTVIAYDHNCFTFYSREERVDGNGWYALRPSGGTVPFEALKEARRILLQSEQPNKLLLIFTDGEWWEDIAGSIAGVLGSMDGVVKVAALIGGYSAEEFEYKSSFDVVQNTAGDILPIMTAAATQILEKSAQGR